MAVQCTLPVQTQGLRSSVEVPAGWLDMGGRGVAVGMPCAAGAADVFGMVVVLRTAARSSGRVMGLSVWGSVAAGSAGK